MSADFHPSNPFRRKETARSYSPDSKVHLSHDASAQLPSSLHTSSSNTIEQIRLQTKPIKKVRVQSPPPSSPEGDSISQKPPTPIPRYDDPSNIHSDPFDTSTSDISDSSDDETATVKSSYVPINPFHKTLATLEHTDVDPPKTPPHATTPGGTGAGRGSLDVEAFKRLLMTGSAETAAPISTTTPPINIGHLGLNDGGGSSTDASSSASRQSIFEPIQEVHPESPRTSHELSDPDDERRRLATSSLAPSDRKKPPPPSSRHGKLIKVELRDENTPALETSSLASRKISQQSLNSPGSVQSLRFPTDLNKPLPAAPARASHESDRESIFDKEAAGKTPEPPSPSPSSSLRRKTPPAPPLTRRHSQLASDSKTNRTPTARLSPNLEEAGSNLPNYASPIQQPTIAKAPPPPPNRRPASIRNSLRPESAPPPALSSHELEKPIPKTGTAPAPPPARLPSNRHPGRPTSVLNMDLTSKRASTAPPPPPPPRQRASSRTSIEVPLLLSESSRRTNSDFLHRSTDGTRGDSGASQPGQTEPSRDNSGANNILADLTALQKEVDALRGQYEKKDVP